MEYFVEETALEERVYITHSVQETEALAEALAAELWNTPALAMYGGLGMGKTAFTRGLARGFGCTVPVSSPTYTIVNEYPGKRKICHFDMYRLGDADALYDIGWEDYLESGALCVTEWSENVPGVFPPGTVEIHFSRLDDETREIKVKLC